MRIAEREIRGHEHEGIEDPDIFYAGDLLKRIAGGRLVNDNKGSFKKQANGLLSRIYKLYPEFKSHKPDLDKMPELDGLKEELIGVSGPTNIDDLPF